MTSFKKQMFLLFVLFTLPALTRSAEATDVRFQTWNIVKDCKVLQGEYENPQAIKIEVKKGTALNTCLIIRGQSQGAYLQLRRLAITENDKMYISGIPKPWMGFGQEPIHFFPKVNTDSNYTAKYIDLNSDLNIPLSEELAIRVSSNVADHDREFIIFYDEDADGSFLGSLFLSTTDKSRPSVTQPQAVISESYINSQTESEFF